MKVRLSVQQKCPPSSRRWYQMLMAAQFPETAAPVDCRRRCTSLRCSCGFPDPLPFLEWTSPSASLVVLPATSPSEEKQAFPARRSPSCQPPPRRQCQGRGSLLRLSRLSAVRDLFSEVHSGLGDWGAGRRQPGNSRSRTGALPGLGGASWEAIIRPSCCSGSRPSKPSSTTTTAPA